MALFSVAIKRFSFICFIFWALFWFSCKLSHFSLEVSIQLSFFNLCFLNVVVFLLVLLITLLLPAAVIYISLLFFVYFSRQWITASMQSSMQAWPLSSSFLDIYSLSMSSLGCKVLCMFICSFIHLSEFFPCLFKECF